MGFLSSLSLVVCRASVKYNLMTALFKPILNYMVNEHASWPYSWEWA